MEKIFLGRWCIEEMVVRPLWWQPSQEAFGGMCLDCGMGPDQCLISAQASKVKSKFPRCVCVAAFSWFRVFEFGAYVMEIPSAVLGERRPFWWIFLPTGLQAIEHVLKAGIGASVAPHLPSVAPGKRVCRANNWAYFLGYILSSQVYWHLWFSRDFGRIKPGLRHSK